MTELERKIFVTDFLAVGDEICSLLEKFYEDSDLDLIHPDPTQVADESTYTQNGQFLAEAYQRVFDGVKEQLKFYKTNIADRNGKRTRLNITARKQSNNGGMALQRMLQQDVFNLIKKSTRYDKALMSFVRDAAQSLAHGRTLRSPEERMQKAKKSAYAAYAESLRTSLG